MPPGRSRFGGPAVSVAVTILRIYPAFAAGYLLSYLVRSVNAVISPELTREFGLASGALGLLTSAYFVTFSALQIPAGILLDRYGPRRVEPVLLVVAAIGCFAFAAADGLAGLTFARALIGAGVSICLMAPLKAIATWFPRDRQASLSGWMMVAGAAGALAATTPVEFALRYVDWRVLFVGIGVFALASAIAIFSTVPDLPRHAEPPSVRTQLDGVRRVFVEPRFWWIVPVGGLGMGSFMAIQGLWSVPWMMEVEGWTRAEAARVLLGMGFSILAGYLFLGFAATRLARRGIGSSHLYLAGWALHAAAIVAIASRAPVPEFWWCLYGLGAGANILAFTVLNEGFPASLAGRANTAINLAMFGSTFIVQWGIGMVVDAARAAFGWSTAEGLRFAFAVAAVLVTATYVWFLAGWRRYAVLPRPAPN